MQNATTVHEIDGQSQLRDQIGGISCGHRLVPLAQVIGKAAAAAVAGYEVAMRARLAHIVHGHEMRMLQLGRRTTFLKEPPP